MGHRSSNFSIQTDPPIPGISFSSFCDFVSDSNGKASKIHIEWPEFEDEMIALTRGWPRVVFTVRIEESNGEFFYCYFKAGRTYTWEPVVIPPPFDEERLELPEL